MKTKFSRNAGTLFATRHSHPFIYKGYMLLLLLMFFAGCRKVAEEPGMFGVCPEIIATNPVNGATGVKLDAELHATFNESMDVSTINSSSFVITDGTTAITGAVNQSGAEAVFVPTNKLEPNTTYTAKIISGVKDPAGNAMIKDYVWSFTTGEAPDEIAPTVILTYPVDDAVNIGINSNMTAKFSEIMDDSTLSNSSFKVMKGSTAVNGTVTYTGTIATFSPTAVLEYDTEYTATITTAATDLAGNALAADYVWTFTTAKQVVVPAPAIGGISLFGVFGGSAGITNQGLNTVINNGSIGTTGASTLITGFHDGTTGDIYTETPLNKGDVKGRIHTAPPAPGSAESFLIATNGLIDANLLYLSISPASKPGGTDPGAGELGGLTLKPGIYKSASGTFNITNGNLTLDAQGDPNAVWIFQTAAGLTVGIAGPTGARSVNMINGGLPKNVFWYVGSAATINGAGGGVMVGNIIASAGVTFSTAGNAVQTVLNGRAISLNASVTMVNTTINVPN